MENHILYTYYDEIGKHIAIVKENATEGIIEELKTKYDEVKYKE